MSSFKNLYIIIFKKINNKLGAKSLAKHIIDPRHTYKKARLLKDSCMKGTLIKIKSEPEKEHAVISKAKCAVHIGKNGNKPKMVLKKKMQFNFVPFLDNPFMWLKGLYKNVYIDDEIDSTKYKVLPSSLCNLPSVSATTRNTKFCGAVHKNKKVLHSKSDTPISVREKSFSPLSSTDSPSVKNISVVTKDISCSTLDERSILATCLCVLPLAQSKLTFKDIKEQQINDKLKTIERNCNHLDKNFGFPNCFQTFKTYSTDLNTLLVSKSQDTVPLTVLHVNVEDVNNQIIDPESSKEQAMTKILSLDNDDKIKLTLLMEPDDSHNKKSPGSINIGDSKIIVSQQKSDSIEHIIKNYKVNLLSTLGDYDFSSFNSPGGKKKPPKKETKKDTPTISKSNNSTNIQKQQQRPLSKTTSSIKQDSETDTKSGTTKPQQIQQNQQQSFGGSASPQQQWQMQTPMQAEQMHYYWPTQAYGNTTMWQNYSQQKSDPKNNTTSKLETSKANEATQPVAYSQMWSPNYMEAYSYNNNNAFGQQQPTQTMYTQMMQANANLQQFQMNQQSNGMDSPKKSVSSYEKICALSKIPTKNESPKKEKKKSAKKILKDTIIQLLNIPNANKQQTSAKQQKSPQTSRTEIVKQNSFGEPTFTSTQTSAVAKQEKPSYETSMPPFDKQETPTQPLVLAASFMPLISKQLSNPIDAQQTAYNNASAWVDNYAKTFNQQQTDAPQQQQVTGPAANTNSWLESYNKTFNQQTPEQLSQQANWHLVQQENNYMAQQAQWNIAQQTPEQLMYQPNVEQTALPPPSSPPPETSYELKTYPQPQEHIKTFPDPYGSNDNTDETSDLKLPPLPKDPADQKPPSKPVVYTQENTHLTLEPSAYEPENSPDNVPPTTSEQQTFPSQVSFGPRHSQETTEKSTADKQNADKYSTDKYSSDKYSTDSSSDKSVTPPQNSKQNAEEDFPSAVRDWEKQNAKEVKVSKPKKSIVGSQYEITKTAIRGTPILNAAKGQKPTKILIMMATSSSMESPKFSKPIYPIVAKPAISEPTLKTRSHFMKKIAGPSIRSAVNIPIMLQETNVLRDILTNCKTDGSLITQQKQPWKPSDPIAKSVQTIKKTASKQEQFGIAKNMLLVKQLKKSWQQNSHKNSNVASLKHDTLSTLLTGKQVKSNADKWLKADKVVTIAKKNTVKDETPKKVPNFEGITTTNWQSFVKNPSEAKQDVSIAKQEIIIAGKKENTPANEKDTTSVGSWQQTNENKSAQMALNSTEQKMPETCAKSPSQNQQQQSLGWSQNALQAYDYSAKWNEQAAQQIASFKDVNAATVEQQQQLLQHQQQQLQQQQEQLLLQQQHLQHQQQLSVTDWQNITARQAQQNFYGTTGTTNAQQQQLAVPQEYASPICNSSAIQQNHCNPQVNPWQQTSSHQYHTLNEAIAKQKLTPVQSEHELQENYKLLDSYSMFDPKTDLYRIKTIKPIKAPDVLKRNDVQIIPTYKSGLIDKVEKHYLCWKKQFFDKSILMQSSKNISIVKQFEATLEQIKIIDNTVPTVDNPETFLPITLSETDEAFLHKEHKQKEEEEKKLVISANQISCQPVLPEVNESPKIVVREEIKSDDMELLSKIDALVDVKPKINSEKSGITTNDSFLLPKQLKDFPNIAKRKLHILNVENVDLEEMCRHSSLLLNCRIVLDGSERNEPNTTLHAKVYDFDQKRRNGLIITPRPRNKK